MTVDKDRKEGRKLAALATLSKVYEIAERLYSGDPARWKPIYGWVGRQVQQRKDLVLVLLAVERVAEKETVSPVHDVVEYLGGTLRKLEQEEEAKKIRASGAGIGDILAPLLKRHSREGGNQG